MMNKRVLFVDDEYNVLQGLRRMLHSMRSQWEMSFAISGKDALEIMAEKSFDVVVSDMRMPEMDGAQLLNEIKRLHPSVIRIILSGHADRELIMSSLGATHQYLSKPCNAETLKGAVERAFSLNSLFEEEPTVKPLIARIHTLPSVPSLYVKIIDELRSPSTSVERVGAIVAEDQAMTAKILQIVNSSFFGHSDPVSSAQRAVQMLGLDTVRTLAMSAHLFEEATDSAEQSLNLERLWQHGSIVGQFALQIAHAEGAGEDVSGNALMAGILHDIGQLVLLTNLPEEYLRLMNMVEREEGDLFELERMYFGASHAEIGAYLLGLWGLPAQIVQAVACHHRFEGIENAAFSASVAVHIANILAHEIVDHGPRAEEVLDSDALEKFEQRLPLWRQACIENIGAAEQSGNTLQKGAYASLAETG